MLRAFSWVFLAYLVAAAVALTTGYLGVWQHPVATAAAADVAATVAVFAFSLAFRNSSFYDAYWSIAPPAILVYWTLSPEAGATPVDPLRRMACLFLVSAWAVRLTWNWARGWQGLDHQDWRYADIQQKTGAAWWPVSFIGIHMMPTLLVFLGCLPLYCALAMPSRPFGALDLAAIAVSAAAIAIEGAADQQLRRFVTTRTSTSELLTSGLWAYSRHPNYFGEILFWWGLFLFGLAADPSVWWMGAGAFAITLLFRFVSLPLIETRLLANKPDFAARTERVNLLLPWFPRTG